MLKKVHWGFLLNGDNVLRYIVGLSILNVNHLREKILLEAYSSWNSIHPMVIMMYKDLRVTYERYISGMGWRNIFWNLWLSVLIVNNWKLNIKSQEVYSSILLFILGSRNILIWFFCCLFTPHLTIMLLDLGYYGVLLHIIYIVVPNLLLSFGNPSKKILVLMLIIVRHFIVKPVDKSILLSKLWKICWELVWFSKRVIGLIFFNFDRFFIQ